MAWGGKFSGRARLLSATMSPCPHFSATELEKIPLWSAWVVDLCRPENGAFSWDNLELFLRYAKHPCFLCIWYSRDRSQLYQKKDRPVRQEIVTDRSKMWTEALCWTKTWYSSHRWISCLAWWKQFTEALDRNGGCFLCLCKTFPGLTTEKLKAGIFDDPEIRKLIRDPQFEKPYEKSGIRSVECCCSGGEEFSGQ